MGIFLKVTGVSCLFIGSVILVYSVLFFEGAIQFLETNASPDGQINAITKIILQGSVFIFGLLCIFFGILFLTNRLKSFVVLLQEKTYGCIASFTDPARVKRFFIYDDNKALVNFNVVTLLASAIVGFTLHLTFLFNGLPTYEGVYEDVSTSVLFLSSVLFFISALQNDQNMKSKANHRLIKTVSLIFAFVILVMVGEELSWGQHFFKWKAEGIFKDYNYQQETNLHNFINPVLPLFYPFVGITAFLALMLAWFFPAGNKGVLQKLFIPPPSFLLLFFFLACAGFYGPGEMFEALLSMGIFLYSIRIFLSKKTGFGRNET